MALRGDLEHVHDVLGVLGVDRVVPIAMRVLVLLKKGVNEEDDVPVVNGK